MGLEQVKAHFKDAKEVKCLSDGKIYSFEKITERGIYRFINCAWFNTDERDVLIYDSDSDRFAEIISYKENDIKVKDAEIVTPKNDPIVSSVMFQLAQRSIIGQSKYGTTLKENNTDDFLQHLKEELMDSIIYIEKLQSQRDA